MFTRLGALGRAIANSSDLSVPSEQLLLRFGGSMSRWALASDHALGGHSECALDEASSDEHERDGALLFTGSTSLDLDDSRKSTERNEDNRAVSKTGWCAMQTEVAAEGWELEEFHGLMLRVRHSGERSFVLNLRSEGVLGGTERYDLYQAHLPPPVRPGEWCTLRIPFGAFQLTWRGYVQQFQPAINRNRLSHLGLLVADEAAGHFAIELGSLAAFRVDAASNEPWVQDVIALNELKGYPMHDD